MFAISTSNITNLRSYEAAAGHFARTKPYKDGSVPLSSRRDGNKRLVKRGDHYECVLYSTAVVTFTPTEIHVKLYPSQSTIFFANCFLPYGVHALSHRGSMWLNVGGEYFNDDLTLVRKDGVWVVKDKPEPATEKVLNKRTAAEVRKRLKPFLLWRAATMRLNPQVIQTYPSIGDLKTLFTDLDNISRYPNVGRFEPDRVRLHAYLHFNAYETVEVPRNRLPKKEPS